MQLAMNASADLTKDIVSPAGLSVSLLEETITFHNYVETINGHRILTRGFVKTSKGMLSAPPALCNELFRAIKSARAAGYDPLDGSTMFHLRRTGTGMQVKYSVTFNSYRAAASFPYVPAGKFNPPPDIIYAPIEQVRQKVVCVCPIRDLMSTGHNPGCPEKK